MGPRARARAASRTAAAPPARRVGSTSRANRACAASYCMPLKCDRVMRIAPPGTPPAGGAAGGGSDAGPWWSAMVGCL